MVEDVGQIGDTGDVEKQRRLAQQQSQAAMDDHIRRAQEFQNRQGSQLTRTKSGKGFKPGGSYMETDHDLMNYENRNMNMGSMGRQPDNPFQKVFDFARGDDDGPQKGGKRN